MSQSGYTPIQLYRTTTASAIPTAGNLAAGELAINLTDEKLYFKNAGGTVTLLASSAGASGTVTSVALSGGTTGLTVSGSPITSSGTITLGGTLAVANGGTGVTTSTGSGSVVLSTSPTLTTPVLGAASATSITNALGAVGTPSYTFTGDTNTGIYSPGADTLAFVEGGTEVMRIDSSSNVGIGTTGPIGKLHVSSSGGSLVVDYLGSNYYYSTNHYFLNTAGTAAVYITPGTSSTLFSTNAAVPLAFGTDNGEKMRISATGNVGIGGTPSTKLDVAATGGMMRVGGASGNNLVQAYTGSVGLGLWAGGSSRIYSGGGITFSINGTLGTSAPTGYTDAAVLTGEGRFLIGTTTGVGNDFTSIRFNSSTTYSQGLNMVDSNASASGTIFQVFRKSDDTNLGLIRRSSTDNALFVGGNSYLALGSGDTERMRIDSSGNVGIGTNSPSFKLDVQGNSSSTATVARVYNGDTSASSNAVFNCATGQGVSAEWYSYSSANWFGTKTNHPQIFIANNAEQARITTAGYLEATYSDKVVALGNSGTATTINLAQGNVFTATLTGNCTFTLSGSNANSNRGSSFTLILTNDGTAGRTVAWAGGSFKFPGGAASLSRTTTANAVDIWVFFTPDNGTTWYGNISMKNMTA